MRVTVVEVMFADTLSAVSATADKSGSVAAAGSDDLGRWPRRLVRQQRHGRGGRGQREPARQHEAAVNPIVSRSPAGTTSVGEMVFLFVVIPDLQSTSMWRRSAASLGMVTVRMPSARSA